MRNFIKICSALLLFMGMTLQLVAQNIGINNNGAAPDGSAILDVSSSNKGLLIPRMDSTARKNIVSPATGLMVYDSTYNQLYSYDGMLWSVVGGSAGKDNLGNHIANQNLQLKNNWLNNDDGANEGIYIDTAGNVGVGTNPLAKLHVTMGGQDSLVIDVAGIGGQSQTNVCQSFTATTTFDLTSIELLTISTPAVIYNLYEGSGTGGTLLAGPLVQSNAFDPFLFSGITLNQGQMYTFEVLNPFGIPFVWADDDYPGGQNCLQPLNDYWFQVYGFITNPGFRIDDNLVQLNNYNIPSTDGTASQILTTDGAGTVSWTNASTTDNQGLSLSGNTLSLSNDATSVDLSSYIDNIDEQDLSLSGHILSLSNDATNVDLSGYLDNTDAQDLNLSTNSLSVTNDATPVDLSIYLDNTDAQDLDLSANSLSLTNDAIPVDLSGYLDNTDAQDLSFSGNTLSLTNDASPSTVDLSPFLNADNLGNHLATQNLELNDNWLNNDGDANEGIIVDNIGQVGINTMPAANFHVDMGSGLGFQVDSTGVKINNYTLKPTLGIADQILTTDGLGNVSWATPSTAGGSADDMGNHTANQSLQLNGNWLSNDGDNEGIFIDNNGRVGLGRAAGSVGHSKLEYYGANASFAGPHIQVVGTNDNFPLYHQLNWDHDNISFCFDSYYDGSWRSASGNSNFQIYKVGGTLYRHFASGITQGDALTWSVGTALTAAGNFGIGVLPATNRLEVNGDASKSTAGNWLANSDARLKKNIMPLSSEEMLDKLLSLRGINYEWNDDKTGFQRPAGIQYGFTAQNIQEVFPSLVKEDNHGYLQTAYGTYDAMTIEAIRALNDKIENIESDKIKLQTKAYQLQSNYEQLESKATELAELKTTFAELETMVEGIQFSNTETTTVNEK